MGAVGRPRNGQVLILGQEQGVLLTVLLMVALVNAMNFVDGLDGLAAGVGLIAADGHRRVRAGPGRSPAATSVYSPALIAFVLAGACLGFLPHNFHPARIFMGDSGSMLIGLMLAAATTSRPAALTRSSAATRWRCSRR